MRVFAFDHRMQLEAVADELGVDRARIGPFKELCLKAAKQVAAGRPGFGLLCDSRLGRDALYAAAGSGLWMGSPSPDRRRSRSW
jgi:5-dehydro-2-deoxygluconokinase